jgi:hypothetical protein
MTWVLAATLAAAMPLAAQGYGKEKVEKEQPKSAFEKVDADGDKVVTLEEVKTYRADQRDEWRKTGEAEDWKKACQECEAKYDGSLTLEQFLRYDTNDDRKLTAAEFSNAKEGDEPSLSDADYKAYSDICFDEWTGYADVKGDSLDLSAFRDQMARHRAALRAKSDETNPDKIYRMTTSHSMLHEYRFLLIADTDRNGTVTRTESQAYWKKRLDGEELKLDDKSSMFFTEQLYLERLSALDFNDDGSLTRDEVSVAFDAPDDAEWNKLDADNDDKLSKEELYKWEEPSKEELEDARKDEKREREKEHEKPETEDGDN